MVTTGAEGYENISTTFHSCLTISLPEKFRTKCLDAFYSNRENKFDLKHTNTHTHSEIKIWSCPMLGYPWRGWRNESVANPSPTYFSFPIDRSSALEVEDVRISANASAKRSPPLAGHREDKGQRKMNEIYSIIYISTGRDFPLKRDPLPQQSFRTREKPKTKYSAFYPWEGLMSRTSALFLY